MRENYFSDWYWPFADIPLPTKKKSALIQWNMGTQNERIPKICSISKRFLLYKFITHNMIHKKYLFWTIYNSQDLRITWEKYAFIDLVPNIFYFSLYVKNVFNFDFWPLPIKRSFPQKLKERWCKLYEWPIHKKVVKIQNFL